MKLKELLKSLPDSTLVVVAIETLIGIYDRFVTLPYESELMTAKDLQGITDSFHISDSEVTRIADKIGYLRIELESKVDPYRERGYFHLYGYTTH